MLGSLCALVVASGCPSPDAEGKYNLFNEQTEDDRDRPEPRLDLPPMDFGAGGQVFPDITGIYLLALETSIAPGLPLQFVADVEAELDESTGDGPVNISFQPLSLEVGSMTEPREPVGDPIVVETTATGGSFMVDFGETNVTGMANPITGSDITANLALQGTIRGENAWCGAVTGDVLSPIQASLEGSTFAAIRLADASERPEMFPVSCDGIMDDDDGGSGGETGGGEESGGGATGTTGG